MNEPGLRGFIQHGVTFQSQAQGSVEVRGTCHICGTNGHLYVNSTSQLWHCKTCGEGGNYEKFLLQRQEAYRRLFHSYANQDPQHPMIMTITQSRKLELHTFLAWNVGWTGTQYTIGVDGNPRRVMTDIRLWSPGKKSRSSIGGHANAIIPIHPNKSQRIWLCEGEWDGMALWELLTKVNIEDEIVAVPGAGIFPRNLLVLLSRKDVVAAFHNDDAGRQACQKVSRLTLGTVHSISYVHWPQDKSKGFDIRDLYTEGAAANIAPIEIYTLLSRLLERKPPPPPVSVSQTRTLASPTAVRVNLTKKRLVATKRIAHTRKVPNRVDVERIFRKWLRIDSIEMLDVIFGSCLANRLAGDPIWMFIVAPPGGMKTEVILPLHDATSVVAITTLTPAALISGAIMAGGADPSLIPQLDGKILVIKDFTAILALNQIARDEIFGILRDAYDGEITRRVGTGVIRSYKSKFGIIAGVTPAVEASNTVGAMLGERFLRYRIEHPLHLSGKRAILRRAFDNIPETEWLRKDLATVAIRILDKPIQTSVLPKIDKKLQEKFIDMALWTAMMRGVVVRDRFTRIVQYKPTHELGTRLVRQFAKLAYGISIFKEENVVSQETYETVCKVARDSIPQCVGEIVKQLYVRHPNPGEKTAAGCSIENLTKWVKLGRVTVTSILEDLLLLDVVTKVRRGISSMWDLSPSMVRLMFPLGFYERERKWLQSQKGCN